MLTAKKIHLILVAPAILLTIVMAGCLNKKCICPNDEEKYEKCIKQVPNEETKGSSRR